MNLPTSRNLQGNSSDLYLCCGDFDFEVIPSCPAIVTSSVKFPSDEAEMRGEWKCSIAKNQVNPTQVSEQVSHPVIILRMAQLIV